MAPAEGDRRLISEMTASFPSGRRKASRNDGGRGRVRLRACNSSAKTGRRSGGDLVALVGHDFRQFVGHSFQ